MTAKTQDSYETAKTEGFFMTILTYYLETDPGIFQQNLKAEDSEHLSQNIITCCKNAHCWSVLN